MSHDPDPGGVIPDRMYEAFPYQFEKLPRLSPISKDGEYLFTKFRLGFLFIDIDEVLGLDKRGFHWVQIKVTFTELKLSAMVDGKHLEPFGDPDIERIKSNYVHADPTLEKVRLLIRLAEHRGNSEHGLKVFVGDRLPTPDGWLRSYWPTDVIDLLESGKVNEISLEDDLGIINDIRGTGADVLDWIEKAVATRG